RRVGRRCLAGTRARRVAATSTAGATATCRNDECHTDQRHQRARTRARLSPTVHWHHSYFLDLSETSVVACHEHRLRICHILPRAGGRAGIRGQAGASWRLRPAASPNANCGTSRTTSRMSDGVHDPAAPCTAPTASGNTAASTYPTDCASVDSPSVVATLPPRSTMSIRDRGKIEF